MTRSFLNLSTTHLSPAAILALNEAVSDQFHHWMNAAKDLIPPDVTIAAATKGDPGGPGGNLLVYPTSFGWICYAHDDFEHLKENGVPPELVDLYRLANERQCDYLMFDRDADILSAPNDPPLFAHQPGQHGRGEWINPSIEKPLYLESVECWLADGSKNRICFLSDEDQQWIVGYEDPVSPATLTPQNVLFWRPIRRPAVDRMAA